MSSLVFLLTMWVIYLKCKGGCLTNSLFLYFSAWFSKAVFESLNNYKVNQEKPRLLSAMGVGCLHVSISSAEAGWLVQRLLTTVKYVRTTNPQVFLSKHRKWENSETSCCRMKTTWEQLSVHKNESGWCLHCGHRTGEKMLWCREDHGSWAEPHWSGS